MGRTKTQPLCPSCHTEKTSIEPGALDSYLIASHFEKRAWGNCVLSERPPPLVYKAKELEDVTGCEIADVRRCRRNALLYKVHAIPCFCPLGAIQERKGHELGDLNFVNKTYRSFVSRPGHTGPG